MAIYVNLQAGVGKPLWEITVGEFRVWFQVWNSQRRILSRITVRCAQTYALQRASLQLPGYTPQ